MISSKTTSFLLLLNLSHITSNQPDHEAVSVSIKENFLTPSESTTLLSTYQHLLHSSAHTAKNGGISRGSKYRTSQSIRLPPLGDDLILDLEQRAASLLQLTHDHCEDFQLTCYAQDELYGLHRDDADGKQSAYRAATVLIYLTEPEGGGETLFTNKALEDELDLDTNEPLSTQDGALKLFRHYCNTPKPEFLVVKPVVGRAVYWKSWNENETKFAKKSTHGACPVLKTKKCVIQQWLYRANKVHPLRDGRVAGIFPAGADSRYRGSGYYDGSNCILDVSAKQRRFVGKLCSDGLLKLNEFGYGPHTGISSLRIQSPFTTILPLASLLQSGFTLSFHAAAIPPNTIVLSIPNYISIHYLGRTDQGLTFQLVASNKSTISFFHWGSDTTDWFWYSFSYQKSGLASFSIFTDRKRVGYGTVSTNKISEDVSLELLRLPRNECKNVAFIQNCDNTTDSYVDVSFIVFHSAVLEDEKELLALSRQAMRYDINQ